MRLLVLAILLAFGLVGCASTSTYPAAVATSLESQVVQVSKDAAARHFDQALAKLSALQAAVAAAEADGRLSLERGNRIVAAIDLVRQDLQSAITAAQQSDLDAQMKSLTDQQKALLEQQQTLEQQLDDQKQASEQQAAQSATDSGSSGSGSSGDQAGSAGKGHPGPPAKADPPGHKGPADTGHGKKK